ncbi:AAT-domain-containing protein [Dichomitus squalens LYAD-421 SS1]|uniref:AAT-domain-containing protein n=1 Tax=Dichomitus squalens (strain LYAD-421) TaxID=732165 RepID=R7SX39_DICSQ|nr:AAT-domain-containing protein [Dichomitus squalens LYAD-421 SS1]EJF60719.1 AAT-domain-containing protein [Dichomitus squalens LYAD-421 SS1]
MSSETFNIPRLELRGSPYEVGQLHGKRLAAQILDQLAIYRELFQEACKFDWAHVRTVAAEFRATIAQLVPHLLQEMEGIADGLCAYADEHGRSVDVLDIVALNARSEIALGQWDDGCTSLAWRLRDSAGSGFERQLLGQNWDWRVGVGKNLAMVSIEQDGKPKIWMVTEPGIVGKIGFNSSSVGVLLNAIRARPISTSLLPIHCLLRISLENESVDSAITAIEKLGGAASSQHILIADTRKARGLELSPRGGVYLPENSNGIVIHTNHFLENRLVDEPPWLSGSPVRLERAKAICGELIRELGDDHFAGDTIDAKLLRARFFSDTFNTPQAICCSPDPTRAAEIQTLFNIVMTFQEGSRPSAEVVFGKPGSGDESEVFSMPW